MRWLGSQLVVGSIGTEGEWRKTNRHSQPDICFESSPLSTDKKQNEHDHNNEA